MLFKDRKGVCALAAAIALWGGAVHAGTHLVMIVDGGYFPAVTYAQPGDILVFENFSEAAHTVKGPEDTWVSDSIPVDGKFTLAIEEGMPLTFTGTGTDGYEVAGEISFNEPPLAE